MPSPNGTKLKLGGKNRTLRYTNRSLVALEDATGLTLTEVSAKAQAGSLRMISTLLWAGLLHAEPEIDVEDVINLVDVRKLRETGEAIGAAVEQAFGPPEEATDEGNAPSTG